MSMDQKDIRDAHTLAVAARGDRPVVICSQV